MDRIATSNVATCNKRVCVGNHTPHRPLICYQIDHIESGGEVTVMCTSQAT